MATDNMETHRLSNNQSTLGLIGKDFDDFGILPETMFYTNENRVPSFMIDGVSDDAKSLAFVMVDEDSPGEQTIHWIMWNIDPRTSVIDENTSATIGKNSWYHQDYRGPTPLNNRTHYSFTVYALDRRLNLPGKTDAKDALEIIREHAIEYATLTGIVESNCDFAIE